MTEHRASRSSFALPDSMADQQRSNRETRMFAGKAMSPNTVLGFGVFGLRRDRAALPPATVYEVNTRHSRKPGLGFSFKF